MAATPGRSLHRGRPNMRPRRGGPNSRAACPSGPQRCPALRKTVPPTGTMMDGSKSDWGPQVHSPSLKLVLEETLPLKPADPPVAQGSVRTRTRPHHSPQEVLCHGRVCRELPAVQGLRGPLHDGPVHAVLHRQRPHCPHAAPLGQALHQAQRQSRQRSSAPERGSGREAKPGAQRETRAQGRRCPPTSNPTHSPVLTKN